jgi:hypothetical protein
MNISKPECRLQTTVSPKISILSTPRRDSNCLGSEYPVVTDRTHSTPDISNSSNDITVRRESDASSSMFYIPSIDRHGNDDSLGTVNLENIENTLNPATELSFNDTDEYVTSGPRVFEPQVEPIRHNPRPARQRRAPDRLGINSVQSIIETLNAIVKQEVPGTQ